jgi:hypothetical protein
MGATRPARAWPSVMFSRDGEVATVIGQQERLVSTYERKQADV